VRGAAGVNDRSVDLAGTPGTFSFFPLFFLLPRLLIRARKREPCSCSDPARDPLRSSSAIPRSKWASQPERRDSRGSDYLFSSQYLLTLSAAEGQTCRWERYIKKRADARAHCSHYQTANARALINVRFAVREISN